MGDRSVTAAVAAASSSWKLKPEVAQQTQGIVASHFAHLHSAEVLFLLLPDNAGGAWLQALCDQVKISDASGSREDSSAAAIAFTSTGLQAMNLPAPALDTFSIPFREGMHQVDRQRRLGDSDAPDVRTVIAGGAQWSGNTLAAGVASVESAASGTPITVHCALIIYAVDEVALIAQLQPVEALLATQQILISHRQRLSLRAGSDGIAREHFGFADGMSQPVLTGDAIVPATGGESEAERHWHGVAAGEILLGHLNAHHEPASAPLVAPAKADEDAGSTRENALTADGAPQGFLNLGLNGSYLVIRELRQDVAAFWQSMDESAQAIGQAGIDGDWLADRIVGRNRDGAPLRPGSVMPPQASGDPANNFGYAHEDVQGFGCPLGAHIRRANPRDSLPSRDTAKPDLSACDELLGAANAHRILRRGRKFGPDIADPRRDDGQPRGLMFMCLNSDLVRQFEFVQQSWLLNQSFATLFDETDPLLGPPGRMTIPATPLRLRPSVQTYVQMVGGEYFFLPSLPALDYLSGLVPKRPVVSR